MGFHGRPPPEGQQGAQLPEGIHQVHITKVKPLDEDYLVVFEDDRERECAQVIPYDIDPETNKKKAWIFWRLAGAFDYPDIDYWKAEPDARPERDWDAFDTLKKIESSGQTCMVEVEPYQTKDGKVKASIKGMWSPRRDSKPTPKIDTSEIPF